MSWNFYVFSPCEVAYYLTFDIQVLCVLLLENTGLKSKDTAARGATIDLLGTIAARLKCDNVSCNRNKFWITEEIFENKDANSHPIDKCCICLKEKRPTSSSIICSVCQRCFHAECVGVAVDDNLFRDWSCHVCVCKRQLIVLHSYCKPQIKKNIKNAMGTGDSVSISRLEIVQQILLSYLQESSSDDDIQLFTRWFVPSLISDFLLVLNIWFLLFMEFTTILFFVGFTFVCGTKMILYLKIGLFIILVDWNQKQYCETLELLCFYQGNGLRRYA